MAPGYSRRFNDFFFERDDGSNSNDEQEFKMDLRPGLHGHFDAPHEDQMHDEHGCTLSAFSEPFVSRKESG